MLIIFALTFCPIFNSSSGFTTLFNVVISELWTKPSNPFSISTNAPNAANLTTSQVTTSLTLYLFAKPNQGFSPFPGYSKAIFLSSLSNDFTFTSIVSFTLNLFSKFSVLSHTSSDLWAKPFVTPKSTNTP